MTPPTTEEKSSLERPIYLLYGDEFLVKEELNRIVEGVLEAGLRKTNLIVLSGADLDEGEFFSLVATPSLFGDPRVIVVEDTTLFSSPKDARRLASRVADAAHSGDKKILLRYMGQLLRLLGVRSPEVIRGDEWLDAISMDGLPSGAREVLRQAAREWLQSRQKLDGPPAETLVEDLVHRSTPEGTRVVFTAETVDIKKPSFRLVQERGHVRECVAQREKFVTRLNREYFDNRVKAILSESGKTISREALARMYELAGIDLRRLQGELNKLLNYIGSKRHIDKADVDNVFEDFHGVEFFELSAAIRTGDIHKCLKALHEHLRIVAHPLQTLSAITGEVRRLLIAKELREQIFRDAWQPGLSFSRFKSLLASQASKTASPDAAAQIAKTHMKPYSLYVSIEASEKYSETRLLATLEDLLSADIILKSSRLGRYGAQAILENVLFRLLGRS